MSHPDVFERIEDLLTRFDRKLEHFMGLSDDLVAAITTALPIISKALTDLVAQAKAGQPPTQAQIDAATNAEKAISDLATAAGAEDPGAPAGP
jgi:hypothetical protein